MTEPENFMEKAETMRREAQFQLRGVTEGEIDRVLDYDEINKIIAGRKQAKLIYWFKAMMIRYPKVEIFRNLVEEAEKVQLTMGEPENARRKFIEVLKSQYEEKRKERNVWTGMQS